MHFFLIGFACFHFVVSRSVVDPPVQPVGIETDGLCSRMRCAAGHTCRLMPNQNCTENCELFARCVTDNTSVLTLPSNGSCPPNQERQACGSSCEPTCAQPVIEVCDERCNVNVCRCKTGYVKDVSDNCIQQSQCPNISVITPPPIKLTCANILCAPGYVCEQIQVNCIRAPCPQPPPKCVPKDGSNGNQNQSCPANEIWNSCGNICEKTCATRNNSVCPLICMINGACVCQQGYVRENGICIPAAQCPTAGEPGSCKANETYSECGSSCEPSCSNPAPKMCTDVCIVGCQCQGGFMRSSIGACVAHQDCSKEEPGSTCANVKCTADTECRMIGTLFCKKEPCPQHPKCVPRIGFPTIAPPPKCDLFCPQGQRCELQVVQCFAAPCNPIPQCVNDTIAVDPPGSSCALVDCAPGFTCKEETVQCFAPPCPPQAQCVPQDTATCETMKCAEGFTCEVDNGIPSCVNNGPSSCAVTLCLIGSQCVEEEIPCLQPPCPKRAKCVSNNSTDLPPSTPCAPTTCPAGSDCIEEDVACFVPPCEKQARCVPNNGTGGATCENVRLKCHEGEQCGMVNGSPTCVPVANCAKNETYRECSSCEKQCGQEPMMCPAVCGPPRCQCENGHSRTTLGNCVLDADCPKNDVAEEPPLLSSCAATSCPVGFICVEEDVPCFVAPCPKQARCDPSNNTNEASCDNVRMKCTEGHQCGMVNGSPTCVPVCQSNETFTECFGCESTCEIDMPMCAASCGSPLCQCNFGYSRNSSGICVKKEDCPANDHTSMCATVKCKEGHTCSIIMGQPKCEATGSPDEDDDRGDDDKDCKKNEVFDGCGGCEATCDNQTPICALACMPGKCVCVPGFVRLNGKCVTYDKCDKIVDTDPVCGPNEDYTECMPSCENNCRGDGCDGNNSTMTIATCTPGCVCKPFYKRDAAGVCRHNRHCYTHAGCSMNEEWSRCRKCEQTCGNANKTCDMECKDDPGCRCKEGLARDTDGHCIVAETGC